MKAYELKEIHLSEPVYLTTRNSIKLKEEDKVGVAEGNLSEQCLLRHCISPHVSMWLHRKK